MPEKQVLFRLDEALLEQFDRKLVEKGYRTRNAWFRDAVEQLLHDGTTGPRKAARSALPADRHD